MHTSRKRHTRNNQKWLERDFAEILSNLEEILDGQDRPDPSRFMDHDSFACSYLAYNLRRKAQAVHGQRPDTNKRREETIKAWLVREVQNCTINQTRTWSYDGYTGAYGTELRVDRHLARASVFVRAILGDAPNLGRILGRSSFGNGASAMMKRGVAQASNKFLCGLSVTPGCYELALQAISRSPAWSELSNSDPVLYFDNKGRQALSPNRLIRVAGAVFDTVRKTKDVDRVILKEPELNGFIQKGIGSEIRSLLKSRRIQTKSGLTAGVDLDHSGSLNSALARWGSISGLVATVDGERASDSLTISLFERVLPPEWFKLLMAVRSPYCVIDGQMVRLDMMSGMGNGFTFELESVLFYALGLACAEESQIIDDPQLYVSIHGDDLIVPTDVFVDVKALFEYCGVAVNSEKSFWTGPFRESCGGHWFNGANVKPFYVEHESGRCRGDWFWLANSLHLWLCSRTDQFLKSEKGQACIILLQRICKHASRGGTWYVSVTQSRRAGLYSTAPSTTGAYKGRMVVPRLTECELSEDGLYLEWLNKPQVRPEPYDVIFPKREAPDRAAGVQQVVEREVHFRTPFWDDFETAEVGPSLWDRLSAFQCE